MEQNHIAGSGGRRDRGIDSMKGLLCHIMMLAHTVFSFGYEETGNTVWKLISHAFHLVGFPGFLFCFGFVCQRAYLEEADSAAVKGRLLRRFFITFAAYLFNAVAMDALLHGRFSLETLRDTLHLNSIHGAVYVLAFALQFLMLLLCGGAIRRIAAKGWLGAVAVAASLGFAALPVIGINLPVVSLFIKTAGQSGYPLLPYYGFFVLGAYFSKNRRLFDWRVTAFALLGGLAFAAYCLTARTLPMRFPPSIFWVLGGYPLVLALYLCCGLIKRPFFHTLLAPFGRRTLYYLTATNLILAVWEYLSPRLGLAIPLQWYIPCYLALVLVCFGLFWLYARLRRVGKGAVATHI